MEGKIPLPPPEEPASSSSDELLRNLRAELLGKEKRASALPRLPWGLLGLVVSGVVLLGLTVFLVFNFFFAGKATLEIAVEPREVNLTLNQNRQLKVDQGTALRLSAGNYRLLFEKEGYISETREVALEKNQTLSLVVALNPIPGIEESLKELALRFPSVSRDGKSFSFYDERDGFFKKWLIEENKVVPLFDRPLGRVAEAVWAPDGSAAIVKLSGRVNLPNLVDNSDLPGAFLQVGERPRVGRALSANFTNLLLDNERRTAKGFQPVKLTDGMRGVAFSPAGDQIAYFYLSASGEKSIIIANRDGGEWRRIIVEGLGGFTDPRFLFSPDGRYLLLYGSTDAAGNRFLVDLTQNSISQITAGGEPAAEPRWSPDSKFLAYQTGSRLELWETQSGKLFREIDLGAKDFVWDWKQDSAILVWAGELKQVELEGTIQPIPFIASETPAIPSFLFYARTARLLLLVYADKVLSLKL